MIVTIATSTRTVIEHVVYYGAFKNVSAAGVLVELNNYSYGRPDG